ncbi:MAG: UspA domain-containing protein [Bacteroidetes bacterium]|nr:MAG: UspA domain-containing protein [Bacteroidota bacterium]
MKNILACTDFSSSGNNAAHYAAGLAKAAETKLILFHVCHLPVATGEVPIMAYDVAEIEKIALERLKKEAEGINKVFGIETAVEVTTGLLTDEVKDAAKKNEAGLVVMGTRGEGNAVGIFGGAAHEVIHRCGLPVLAIPGGATWRPFKKIVFASDLHKDEHPQYDILRRFANMNNAKVLLVSMLHKNETPSMEKAVAGVRLEHDFEGMRHEMLLLENDDTIEGLNKFVEEENADLLVVLPHRHNIFKRLFGTTHTQKMLRHAHLPLLALPETV